MPTSELVARYEDYLRNRHMMMWLSLSNLQFYHVKPGSTKSWETYSTAKAWRGTADVTGHNWLLGSGYQERNYELYSLAGEVQRKVGN